MISKDAEAALLVRYKELCRQMDVANTPGDFRPGWADAIRKEMAIMLPMLDDARPPHSQETVK